MQWVGNDKQVVLVLTEELVLHRSPDSGKTFENQMSKFSDVASKQQKTISGIRYLLVSAADPNRIFFVGSGNTHFVTRDGGVTYEFVNSVVPFEDIKLSPSDPDAMIAAEDTCASGKSRECYRKLWASYDFGRSWTFLADRVQQFDWLDAMPPAMRPSQWNPEGKPHGIIATIFRKHKRGHQNLDTWDTDIDFVVSLDDFKSQRVIVEHGNRFLIMSNRFFVARNLPSGSADAGGVGLLVLVPAVGMFEPILMPRESQKLQHHGFTVVDTSEGQVFLQINHQGEGALWGNLYASGAAGIMYSLSLPDNRRNEDGTCDFAKFEGMEGIYVANIYDQDSIVGGGSDYMGKRLGDTPTSFQARKAARKVGDDPNIRTVITYNKGSKWSLLNPPTKDSQGKSTDCFVSQGCSLHIHGTSDYWGPFYSLKSAVGLAMATGNLGSRLTRFASKTNTYFTRDGGLSWFEAAKGSHIYEFGDHGGIILMARDNVPTQTLSYSWDQGASWTQYTFSAEPVEVNNIIVERSGKDLIFLLYGTQEGGVGGKKRQSVLFYLDFSLGLPQCEGSDSATGDFEQWEPRASFQSQCILGHEVKYTRRKRTAACITGKFHERKEFVRDCACVDEDFECDINYHRPNQVEQCQYDSSAKPNHTMSILHQCARKDNMGYYFEPNGYRKIAGDTCSGGVNHLGSQKQCPAWALTSGGGMSWFKLFFYALLFCGLGGCLVFTEMGSRTLSATRAGFDMVLEKVGASGSGGRSYRGYQQVARHDYDEEGDFGSSGGGAPRGGGFTPFRDDTSTDVEQNASGSGRRNKQQQALDRVAAALDTPDNDDDDDDDLGFDDDDLDFDDPVDDEESLI